jgi:hypothetical protein
VGWSGDGLWAGRLVAVCKDWPDASTHAGRISAANRRSSPAQRDSTCQAAFLANKTFPATFLSYGVFTPWTKGTCFVTFSPIAHKKLNSKTPNAMKTKKQVDEANDAIKKSAPVKTLSLQVAVSEPDLQKAVQVAFDLAKSGGRELNLVFNLPTDIGTAHFALPRLGC